MAKKWHGRGTTALSSVLAIVVLLGAGAALAATGGVADLVSGARDGLLGHERGSASAPDGPGERTRATRSGSAARGGSSAAARGGSSAAPDPSACARAMRGAARARQHPSDGGGIANAIRQVTGSCGNDAGAKGLVTALEHLEGRGGAGTQDHRGRGAGDRGSGRGHGRRSGSNGRGRGGGVLGGRQGGSPSGDGSGSSAHGHGGGPQG